MSDEHSTTLVPVALNPNNSNETLVAETAKDAVVRSSNAMPVDEMSNILGLLLIALVGIVAISRRRTSRAPQSKAVMTAPAHSSSPPEYKPSIVSTD